MKRIFIVLMLSSFSYALQAPYLISATATGDSSVMLSWRNNDNATQGYLVQRKDSTLALFTFIDSIKTASTMTYIDKKNILPKTSYTYQVIAYNSTEISVASNTQQVMTDSQIVIIKNPNVWAYWDYQTSTSVLVKIYDSISNDKKYEIYRAEGSSSSFVLTSQISGGNTGKWDTAFWNDTTISYNKLYTYRLVIRRNNDSLFSATSSVYTFNIPPQERVARLVKESIFPITLSGFSALSGDSIICKEANSQAGKFTVINVSDIKNPSFSGYADSTKLLTYPNNTLIPFYLQSSDYNRFPYAKIVSINNTFLKYDLNGYLYKYLSNNHQWVKVDSMNNTYMTQGDIIPCGNDSMAWFIGYFTVAGFGSNCRIFTLKVTDNAFTRMSDTIIATSQIRGPSTWIYFNGAFEDRSMFTIMAQNLAGIFNDCNYIVRDFSLPPGQPLLHIGFGFKYGGFTPKNTGYYISPTENISTSFNYGGLPTRLYSVDIRNPHAIDTVVSRKALYVDSVHICDSLRNILFDKSKKRIYLVYSNSLIALSYSYDPLSDMVYRHSENGNTTFNRIKVLENLMRPSVIIILRGTHHSSDLFFYDLSGRLVDEMTGITSNAVLWRPKTLMKGCYFVVIKSGKERFVERFMVR